MPQHQHVHQTQVRDLQCHSKTDGKTCSLKSVLQYVIVLVMSKERNKTYLAYKKHPSFVDPLSQHEDGTHNLHK